MSDASQGSSAVIRCDGLTKVFRSKGAPPGGAGPRGGDSAGGRPPVGAAAAGGGDPGERTRGAKGQVVAVDGLTLRIEQGELYGMIGPDGAGKSTTIRLLTGLLTPTAGAVHILDLDTVSNRQARQLRSRIGYVSQRANLYADLTVLENLRLFARLQGVDRRAWESRVPSLLASAGLVGIEDRLGSRLSGGMRQKLALACALVHAPEVLFLDEPTLGVDPVSRREFWELLERLPAERGATVFVCTPYMDEAERCGRVGLLHRGRLLAEGSAAELRARVTGQVLLCRAGDLRGAKECAGSQPGVMSAVIVGDTLRVLVDDAQRRAPELAGQLRLQGNPVFQLNNGEPTLEEAFISLVHGAPGPAAIPSATVSAAGAVPSATASAAGAIPSATASAAGAVPGATDSAGILSGVPAISSAGTESKDAGAGEQDRLLRLRSDKDRGSAQDAPRKDAIVVEDLTKVFRIQRGKPPVKAVDCVSFTVPRGEIFGCLGPNGAGKTTTIRVLMGLLQPTSGRVRVLGLELPAAARAVHARSGYMSQRFTLYNDLTARENLRFYAQAYGLGGKQMARRLADMIAVADLWGLENELAANLPGGWRQRLALACAMVHDPELIFLDEPTAGVDPAARRGLWDLVYRLAEQGKTIFVTTHYMDEAELCQRLAFMSAGRIAAIGAPADLVAGYAAGIDSSALGKPPSIEDVFITLTAPGAAGDRQREGAVR